MDRPGKFLEHDGKENQEGHKAQHHQRQGVVEHQHGPQHTEDHHGVLYQCHQDVGKQVADGVGVVTHPGHQLAHGDLVQLLVGKAFDAAEDVQPELGQDLLAHLLEDHGLKIGADHGHHQNAGVHRHHPVQLRQGEISLDDALNFAHQQRRDHIVGDGHQHDDKYQYKFLFIGDGVL